MYQEKQLETRQNVPQRNVRKRQPSESGEGFGIDQTASFLSSGGVVLDDLLKLKQPQKGEKYTIVFGSWSTNDCLK